ncbi:MAG: integrase [Deltaproteobacteria bacterium]|nr:MAG: integrase [Deltaproteobacteria bacterium]
MSPFESFLSEQFEDYIAYRHQLGYDTKGLQWVLRTLDRHLLRKKAEPADLTPAFFLTLQAGLQTQSKSVNRLLSTTRMFFNYLVRKDVCQDNPLKDIPLLAEERFIPFVFSPAQIDQLLETLGRSLRREPMYFVKELGIYLAILLLARCGMRIYEPLRLKRYHFRADDHTLYVEKTKFKKDRLIPIPGAVAVEITNYLAVRQSLWGADDNPYLLAASPKKPFYDYLIRPRFHQAVGDIGLSCPRQTIGTTNIGSPTPHSLRHSFAVNTLKRITEQGRSPQHALPVLAAYLGHCEYKHTTKYLKLLDASHRHNLVAFIQTQAHRP